MCSCLGFSCVLTCSCRCLLQRGSCSGHCFLKTDCILGSGRPRLLYPVEHVAEHLVEIRRRHSALGLVFLFHALRPCLFPKHLLRVECTDQHVRFRRNAGLCFLVLRACFSRRLPRLVSLLRRLRAALHQLVFAVRVLVVCFCTSCASSSRKFCGRSTSGTVNSAPSALFEGVDTP